MTKGEMIGFHVLNQYCYVPSLIESAPQVRRTAEIKHQILEDLFGWQLATIEEHQFIENEDQKQYIRELLGLGK